MRENQFPEKAIRTAADAFERFGENTDGEAREQMSLLQSLAEISNFYDISPKNRTDFAIEGLERFFDRKKKQSTSDFRETLESLSYFWGEG